MHCAVSTGSSLHSNYVMNTVIFCTKTCSRKPEDLSENDVSDWLYSYNIKRVKVSIPKCKRTGKSRDFCFINFQSRIEAEKSIDKLNKQKFDYCLVNVEYAK